MQPSNNVNNCPPLPPKKKKKKKKKKSHYYYYWIIYGAPSHKSPQHLQRHKDTLISSDTSPTGVGMFINFARASVHYRVIFALLAPSDIMCVCVGWGGVGGGSGECCVLQLIQYLSFISFLVCCCCLLTFCCCCCPPSIQLFINLSVCFSAFLFTYLCLGVYRRKKGMEAQAL